MSSHTYCYVSASRFLGPFFICSRLCSMSSSIVISPCLTFVKYLPRMCCGRVFQPGQGTWPGTSQMHWRSKLRPKLAGFCRMDAVACSSNRRVSLESGNHTKYKLRQLERLRSEDTSHRPMITHISDQFILDQHWKIWSFGKFFKFVTLTLSCFDLGSSQVKTSQIQNYKF